MNPAGSEATAERSTGAVSSSGRGKPVPVLMITGFLGAGKTTYDATHQKQTCCSHKYIGVCLSLKAQAILVPWFGKSAPLLPLAQEAMHHAEQVDSNAFDLPCRLLNYILLEAHGYRCAVILNEFGESAGIEKALLNDSKVRLCFVLFLHTDFP